MIPFIYKSKTGKTKHCSEKYIHVINYREKGNDFHKIHDSSYLWNVAGEDIIN